MKKLLTPFLSLLLMASGLAASADVSYSWESPEGTPIEVGGVIKHVSGSDNRLNYKNSDYYTICLNGKKANINDSEANNNTSHMELTLDKALKVGDKIEIYGYINKGTDATANAYISFRNDEGAQVSDVSESESYPDIHADAGSNAPGTHVIDVPEAAAGCKSIWFTRNSSGTNLFIISLKVSSEDDAETPEVPGADFGDGTLAAPAVWPLNNSAMLPLGGNIVLSFEADVTVNGKATLGDKDVELKADGNTVTVAYAGLDPKTEYTLTIPAATIGNESAANEDLSFSFTTEPANTLYYSDFSVYPFDYYDEYATSKIEDNVNIIAKGSTDVTAVKGGITYYSGTSGRVVAMKNPNNSAEIGVDYGPETENDFGASNRCVQLIDGGNGLYMEFPEVEGPVDLTLFVANAKTTAGTIVLTDENGNTAEPLASFELPASKSMKKFTYAYPYSGAVRLRLYNMKNQINVNDVLIVKGDGTGEEKPDVKDEEAPVLTHLWPSEAPYAPVEGTITLRYNEDIVVSGQAIVNGVATDVAVDGKVATIAYSGLENGKEYKVTVPAVADEAGNANEAFDLTINTVPADVLYYSDFASFPYSYWTQHYNIPNEAVDNNDIIVKNSTDVTAECGGITYYSGESGRVVAMGKSNLLEDATAADAGASQRCIQIIGGGGKLYAELPEMDGPCDITLFIGNSTEKEIGFELRNGVAAEALAAFTMPAEKKMFKHTYSYTASEPVKFRIYNNGNQFNVHDILVVKGENSAIANVIADENAETVYYNLQGVRVDNPAGGIFIRVRGNNVDKVVIR